MEVNTYLSVYHDSLLPRLAFRRLKTPFWKRRRRRA